MQISIISPKIPAFGCAPLYFTRGGGWIAKQGLRVADVNRIMIFTAFKGTFGENLH
jgi:hypothetical protein